MSIPTMYENRALTADAVVLVALLSIGFDRDAALQIISDLTLNGYRGLIKGAPATRKAAAARDKRRRRVTRIHQNAIWTAEDEKMLTELWSQRINVSVIAKRLGRTTNSVYARASKLGLRRRPTEPKP